MAKNRGIASVKNGKLADKDENGKPYFGSDENLIIYFAGHGHLDSRLGEGYWAP